jgi:hypothetical protein
MLYIKFMADADMEGRHSKISEQDLQKLIEQSEEAERKAQRAQRKAVMPYTEGFMELARQDSSKPFRER